MVSVVHHSSFHDRERKLQVTEQRTHCPRCNAETHIFKAGNLRRESIEVISCEACGSVYTRHDGTHWSLIVSSNKAREKETKVAPRA